MWLVIFLLISKYKNIFKDSLIIQTTTEKDSLSTTTEDPTKWDTSIKTFKTTTSTTTSTTPEKTKPKSEIKIIPFKVMENSDRLNSKQAKPRPKITSTLKLGDFDTNFLDESDENYSDEVGSLTSDDYFGVMNDQPLAPLLPLEDSDSSDEINFEELTNIDNEMVRYSLSALNYKINQLRKVYFLKQQLNLVKQIVQRPPKKTQSIIKLFPNLTG